MKISLVTVCYNSERTINGAIESVLAQEGVDLEYIVIDGASKDDTVRVVHSALANAPAHIRYRVLSEPDKGMYDALNKGLALATGDIVGILNSDDTLADKSVLKRIAESFDDDVDAVYSDVKFVRHGRTVRYYSASYWRPWFHRLGVMPPHPGVYVRRESIGRIGPYRLGYRISADFEWMLRYLCQGRLRIRYVPLCSVDMMPGGRSTCGWRANILLNRENVRAERENGYFSCFLFMLPKYLLRAYEVVRTRF